MPLKRARRKAGPMLCGVIFRKRPTEKLEAREPRNYFGFPERHEGKAEEAGAE